MAKLAHKKLSDKVLEVAFKVHNSIGPGLLESAYHQAFCTELLIQGISYEREKSYPVMYEDTQVGYYLADVVLEDTIIVELKAVKNFHPSMYAQIINYLRLSHLPVGYLINFFTYRVEWKRFVKKDTIMSYPKSVNVSKKL